MGTASSSMTSHIKPSTNLCSLEAQSFANSFEECLEVVAKEAGKKAGPGKKPNKLAKALAVTLSSFKDASGQAVNFKSPPQAILMSNDMVSQSDDASLSSFNSKEADDNAAPVPKELQQFVKKFVEEDGCPLICPLICKKPDGGSKCTATTFRSYRNQTELARACAVCVLSALYSLPNTKLLLLLEVWKIH